MKITRQTTEILKRYKLYALARGAYSIYSQVKNRLFSGPVILLYHRVAELDRDPLLLSVSPERFREQMKYLAENYRIVSLHDMKQAIASRKLDPESVAVTFDDGYEDNYRNARPILEQFQIPATIFVVTGNIGAAREFWWDALERLLLSPEVLPDSLEVTIRGKVYRWQTGGAAKPAKGRDEPPGRKWDITSKPEHETRHPAFIELHGLLRTLNDAEQREVLDVIARWAGGAVPQDKQDLKCMSPAELKSLADGGLINIGAHTVTHPVLALQPPETQRREIIDSKRQLEDILQRPVTAFSYPFGSREDVDVGTIQLVRDAGFEVACADVPAYIDRWSNPLWLPRWVVRDWSIEELASRLKVLRS